MSIYDLAAELGAGLLSHLILAVPQLTPGLGVGFNRVSDRLRAAKAENEKKPGNKLVYRLHRWPCKMKNQLLILLKNTN